MSTLSQFGFGGGIKSIQRGTIVLPTPRTQPTQTVTISPVNTSKSILYYLGVANGFTPDINAELLSISAMIELTNSTTITATTVTPYSNLITPPVVSWQLVEYY